jgi:hypothetical protein
LADIAELLGELQQPNFRAYDLLFGRHGVLQCRGGRFATPTASRPAPACDSPWGPGSRYLVPNAPSGGQCHGFLVNEVAPLLKGNNREACRAHVHC